MAEGQSFELSNELFHLIKDITNIEGLGWQLKGNILGLNFELYDENGDVIAVIAILITLQHMINDREEASSASSSSASSGQ